MGRFWTQYRSMDGNWYDNQNADTLEHAKALWDYSVNARRRPATAYRIIERTDKVVWPLDETIDPASQGGA